MKTKLKPFPLLHPSVIGLVATSFENQVNLTTIGDIAVAGLNPPLMMVSLHQNHKATHNIDKTNVFSVNIPTVEMKELVDYCGMVSGNHVDKSPQFDFEIFEDIPTVSKAPISILLKVMHRHQIKQRVIFIAEVTSLYINDSLMVQDQLDLSSIKSILYGLNNHYYQIGHDLGEAGQTNKKTET